MVDLFQLTSDIVADTVSLALPGLLWVVLFLVAWERGPFAESIGFGRKSFWLLLPGAILATFGLLPIAPVSTDWVTVSFAGAIFPLLVGLLAFGRVAPPRSRSLSRLLVLLAVEGGLLFLLVLPVTAGLSHATGSALGLSDYVGNELVVLAGATAFSAVVGGVALASDDPLARRVAFLVALTSAVLVLTFVASSAIPGVGITESFPFFLIPPVGAGLAAAGLARRVFPKEEGFAIPTAFLGSTFGVLLGADLLRQPPLYGTGPSGLYTIGGAGILDLVYISGILAFVAAYLGHRALGRDWTPVGTPVLPIVLPPITRLARAFRAGLDGRLSESLHDSAAASRAAVEQARGLLGLGPAAEDRPWQDLRVPGWVVADQANLDASARVGTGDGREGFRSWRTARWLVWIARDIGVGRFATVGARISAFLVDLAVVTLPAVAVWAALLLTMPGGFADALSNVAFNAAIFGFIAWAFLYFVLAETFWGTTLGKRLLGLEVRERTLATPSGLSSLVRNTTVLPLLTVVGIGVAIALAFGLKAGTSTTLTLGGVALPVGILALVGVLSFVLGGIALLGVGAVVLIAATSERQRLGDLWAGTWVVRRLPETPSGDAVRAGAEGTRAPPSPPGPGPFG
ncbi:MAG: RDD family protein [Thermoplasmata archaeon]|nr:RDD family protein [Thermoplasmata archaeon]